MKHRWRSTARATTDLDERRPQPAGYKTVLAGGDIVTDRVTLGVVLGPAAPLLGLDFALGEG
jgi:hypothetical protein